jgi:hypothetical protein
VNAPRAAPVIVLVVIVLRFLFVHVVFLLVILSS